MIQKSKTQNIQCSSDGYLTVFLIVILYGFSIPKPKYLNKIISTIVNEFTLNFRTKFK